MDQHPRLDPDRLETAPRRPEAALRGEAALRRKAKRVTRALAAQREAWQGGFTRRRVLAGLGGLGVASLGSQLVTTRVAFGAAQDGTGAGTTLVVIFLRGGVDGLSVIVPRGDAALAGARPRIAVPDRALLPGDDRFGLHPALAPLHPLWTSGRLAAVHAVGSPDLSRSHFQAQDCLERGAATTSVTSGWLDRVLAALGPGTTFRAVANGAALPRSLIGPEPKLVLQGIERFDLAGGEDLRDRTVAALTALYTGLDHPVAAHAQVTLRALAAARELAQADYQPGVDYPEGGFAGQLRDVARLIKARVGLRVAAIDLGGWDMHTWIGPVDDGGMRRHLADLAAALAAFAADLGPALDEVTLVTMSEFGRRVAENGNAGADHGHGGIMLLLGGGLRGGRVHGGWPGLAPSALVNGDLAGVNDYRDVLTELLQRRLGIGDPAPVFPDHRPTPLGIFT
jgi:uncharacterized protein (DUF1501 family)